ncbi:MAG TPA: condensation domain-containing protein, partial [Allosphingosinicella sp.]|nr:condensation domain-containing protein [Allosphingosinicella sp.]
MNDLASLANLPIDELLAKLGPGKRFHVTPTARPEHLPLSFGQERIWFVDQLGVGHAYKIGSVFRLRGDLDWASLSRALREIVRRHEILRTRLVSVDGVGAQVVDPPAVFVPELVELGVDCCSNDALLQRIGALLEEPLDLGEGPVFRAVCLRLASNHHVLVLIAHHAISDGWSRGILAGELEQLYAAYKAGLPPPLPELALQYADYALWQREWLKGEELDRQLAFWEAALAGA